MAAKENSGGDNHHEDSCKVKIKIQIVKWKQWAVGRPKLSVGSVWSRRSW